MSCSRISQNQAATAPRLSYWSGSCTSLGSQSTGSVPSSAGINHSSQYSISSTTSVDGEVLELQSKLVWSSRVQVCTVICCLLFIKYFFRHWMPFSIRYKSGTAIDPRRSLKCMSPQTVSHTTWLLHSKAALSNSYTNACMPAVFMVFGMTYNMRGGQSNH